MRIEGKDAELVPSLQVLGMWLDPTMTWNKHIKRAVLRGSTAFEAMLRITASTWGPSVRKSRLLYSAVVRPIMTYGAQVWSVQTNGELIEATKSGKIGVVQNRCIRRVMGAYQMTQVAALEKESGIPPIGLHMESIALQRAVTTEDHPVTTEINRSLDKIWKAAHGLKRGRGGPRKLGAAN